MCNEGAVDGDMLVRDEAEDKKGNVFSLPLGDVRGKPSNSACPTNGSTDSVVGFV